MKGARASFIPRSLLCRVGHLKPKLFFSRYNFFTGLDKLNFYRVCDNNFFDSFNL